MRNKTKKCNFTLFFFPMKEVLVWLHVQIGKWKAWKNPKDISKDRNDRGVRGKWGTIDSEACEEEFVELCQNWSLLNVIIS